MILSVNSGSASGSSVVKVAASGCNMPWNLESKIRYHLRASSLLFPNPHLPQPLLSSAGLLPDSHYIQKSCTLSIALLSLSRSSPPGFSQHPPPVTCGATARGMQA